MIKGRIKRELTMDSILEKISEYDIYKYYFGEFELNKPTCNHLRGDRNPSFIIGNKYGNLSHFDFGDPTWRGDCFSLVKKMYGLADLNSILEKIDSDFGLGFRGIEKDYKIQTSKYEQPKVTKRTTFIQVITGKFTKEELSYWNEYYQDITDLRDNEIYHIKTLYLNKQKFPLKDTELRFGYFYPKGGYWKIYFPFAKDKRHKWLGNVPLQTSWGVENLNKDKNSLILKSLKDYMVCKKIYQHVCGVQNESLGAFSEEFVEKVNNKSQEIFCCFDSDNPGKGASFAVTKAFGWKHVNSPDSLLPDIKDMAEWGRIKGLKAIETHLLNKKVII